MTVVTGKRDQFHAPDTLTCAVCEGDCTTVAPVCADCVEWSRWRRVEDELPGLLEHVLVAGYGEMEMGFYGGDGCWLRIGGGDAVDLAVQHWRPLPLPPQEAKP